MGQYFIPVLERNDKTTVFDNHFKVKGYVDCLHPLPILTSTSNGQGSGDYYGINEDYAGRWCYDEIVVYNDKKKIPDTATELVVTFNEHINKDEFVEGVA